MDAALMAKEVLNLPEIRLVHRPAVWTNLNPWHWEAEIGDYYNLWIGLAGEGSLDVDGVSHQIAPGRAFLFAPRSRVKARQVGDGTMVNFAAHFVFAKGRPPARRASHGIEVPRDADLDLRVREIAARARWNDPLAAREVQAMVFLVLAQLWRLHHQRQRPKAPRLEALLEAIDAEPHRFGRVEQMVAFMSASPAHLRRMFVERVGCSPRDYLVARKIERAQMLLQTSRLNVAEIADALGYDAAFYFSRQFKRICKLSPQHWRRRAPTAKVFG